MHQAQGGVMRIFDTSADGKAPDVDVDRVLDGMSGLPVDPALYSPTSDHLHRHIRRSCSSTTTANHNCSPYHHPRCLSTIHG